MSASKPRRYRSFPKTLGECVLPITRPALEKHGMAHARIVKDWKIIVGPELAARTAPARLSWPKGKNEGGLLTLRVSGGFATEVQHLEPYILEKLAAYFGYRAVARLRIEHGVHAHTPPRARHAAPPPEGDVQAALAQLERALQNPRR